MHKKDVCLIKGRYLIKACAALSQAIQIPLPLSREIPLLPLTPTFEQEKGEAGVVFPCSLKCLSTCGTVRIRKLSFTMRFSNRCFCLLSCSFTCNISALTGASPTFVRPSYADKNCKEIVSKSIQFQQHVHVRFSVSCIHWDNQQAGHDIRFALFCLVACFLNWCEIQPSQCFGVSHKI